jgi:predicted Zn finger-like uncharacterized protein
MSGQDRKIDTRCPACDARYRVPSTSLGHHARCGKCRTSFRVSQAHPAGHNSTRHRSPTEDDILRWLNEGTDEEYIAARPRVIGSEEAGTQPRPATEPDEDETEEQEDPEPGSQPVEAATPPTAEDRSTAVLKSS